MISDKERRRAVAELREASTGAYRHVDSLDVIAGSVGVEVAGKFSHEVENETYAALADLIDRGECENVYDGSVQDSCDNGFLCSVCGCKVEDEEHYHVSGTWNFCPRCGRVVVKR
nr:MAG TPA: DNA-directed RNA polymerase [Caudoviricetes sp.]